MVLRSLELHARNDDDDANRIVFIVYVCICVKGKQFEASLYEKLHGTNIVVGSPPHGLPTNVVLAGMLIPEKNRVIMWCDSEWGCAAVKNKNKTTHICNAYSVRINVDHLIWPFYDVLSTKTLYFSLTTVDTNVGWCTVQQWITYVKQFVQQFNRNTLPALTVAPGIQEPAEDIIIRTELPRQFRTHLTFCLHVLSLALLARPFSFSSFFCKVLQQSLTLCYLNPFNK